MAREDDITRTAPGGDPPGGPAPTADWRQRIAAARAQADAVPRPAPLPPREDDGATEIDPVAVPGYRLVRRISRGGQGAVYEALRNDTQRRVAIKLLKVADAADAPERVRFRREVEILRKLRDPRIVAIHEHGVVGSRAYFVMDYIEGPPLDEYLAAQPRSLRRIIGLLSEICEAVHAAHRMGVIHRDIKPANVLIDEEGRPSILDFGLARSEVAPGESDLTRAGEFVGSLLWASPEQLEGEPGALDVRTDVYSLGVVLYQTLTGQFPYAVSAGARQAALSIREVEPIRPRDLHPDVDPALEGIILCCLEKDRAGRYADAGTLARDLRRWLDDEPVQAHHDAGWSVRPRSRSGAGLLRVTAAARRVAESLLGRTVIADLADIDVRTSPKRLAAASLILLAAGELVAGILALALIATAFSARDAVDWIREGFNLLILGAYICFVPATLGLILLRPMADDPQDGSSRRALPWRGAIGAAALGVAVAGLVMWKGQQSATDLLVVALAIAPGAALLRLIGKLLRQQGEVRSARHARVEFRGLLLFGALALTVLGMRSSHRIVESYRHVLYAVTTLTLILGVALGVGGTLLLAGLSRVTRRGQGRAG